MPVPGSPEWYARVASMLAEEAAQPMRWWYMSFVDPELPEGHRFLGGILIEARGPTEAMLKSHHQGINPGGEVATMEGAANLRPRFRSRCAIACAAGLSGIAYERARHPLPSPVSTPL